MGRVGFVSHTIYSEHEMGHGHPESPDRLRAIRSQLESSGTLDRLVSIEPRPAERKWVEAVHDSSYLLHLDTKSPTSGYASMDADTTLCPQSVEAAYMGAGGALAAADAVMSQEVDQVFCAVRPPGHHAESNRAMGFCLLNNVAIVTKYLQTQYGLERILIVDWDVHHGNGTQHTFYEDPSVLFFSTHQFPHYPGTGNTTEIGRGEGRGRTLNIPMSGGQGDDEYQEIFESRLIPAADSFHPDCVVISAGFDAHRDDPLASMNLTEDGYGMLTEIVMGIAGRHASGRVISCLEGGYHLNGLASSVERHLLAMLDS